MYKEAIVNKEEFEKGLKEILEDVDKNGQQYFFVGIPITITKGVEYVVEKLGAIFVLKLVGQFLNDPVIIAARLVCGYKSLLILESKEDLVTVSLYINDSKCVEVEIKDRKDIPDVRVAMIMGQKVLYLLAED